MDPEASLLVLGMRMERPKVELSEGAGAMSIVQEIPDLGGRRTEVADVFYTYSPAEEEARRALIEAIEAEKRIYLDRIEPLMQKLSQIHGTPHMVLKTAPR